MKHRAVTKSYLKSATSGLPARKTWRKQFTEISERAPDNKPGGLKKVELDQIREWISFGETAEGIHNLMKSELKRTRSLEVIQNWIDTGTGEISRAVGK